MQVINKICLLCIMLLLVGCVSNSYKDVDTTAICSAILDAAVCGDQSEQLSDECFAQLQDAGNPGGIYDNKQIEVKSVFADGEYVCICSAEYTFESNDFVNYFLYKITFVYDFDANKVINAEVQNYATI